MDGSIADRNRNDGARRGCAELAAVGRILISHPFILPAREFALADVGVVCHVVLDGVIPGQGITGVCRRRRACSDELVLMGRGVIYHIISPFAASAGGAVEGVEQAQPVSDLVYRQFAIVEWAAWVDILKRRERNHYPIPAGITGVVTGKRPPPDWVLKARRGAATDRIQIQRVRTALV